MKTLFGSKKEFVISVILILIVLGLIFGPNNQEQMDRDPRVQAMRTALATKPTLTPTPFLPEPIDPCKGLEGNLMQQCRDNQARQKYELNLIQKRLYGSDSPTP